MSDKYEILTDRTLDGLDKQINDMAEKGYELDKFEQNNCYEGEWQGIAIMKRMSMPTNTDQALNIDSVSNSVRQEVERRRDLIMNEPDGLVRETMISNLAIDL